MTNPVRENFAPLTLTEYLEIIYRGRETWNTWRRSLGDRDFSPDLSDLRLSKFADDPDLSGFDLSRCRLRRANLSRISMSGANLADADLREIQLSGVSLHRCNLHNADLRDARIYNSFFHRADLTGANLTGAVLQNVDFQAAILNRAIFGNNDLSVVQNLDKAVVDSSVVLGIQTLTASQGRIAPIFLKKAGVPPEILTLAARLAERPVTHKSCFISHSSKDSKFVDKLCHDLSKDHVKIFYSKEDLRPGQRFRPQLEAELRSAGKIIIVVSRTSLQSDEVASEVRVARERENLEQKELIIPLSLLSDDDWVAAKIEWAFSLRDLFTPRASTIGGAGKNTLPLLKSS